MVTARQTLDDDQLGADEWVKYSGLTTEHAEQLVETLDNPLGRTAHLSARVTSRVDPGLNKWLYAFLRCQFAYLPCRPVVIRMAD
jgi:hypothetical protein